MIGFSTLQSLFSDLISTGLVPKEIFHSVIIRDDGQGNKKPSAPVGKRFVYVGINDSKTPFYCRAIGPLETIKTERVHSTQIEYTVQALHRIVLYNQYETRSHDDIAGALTKVVMRNPKTKFVRLYTDAQDILRQEQPTGTFELPTSALYIAIEFNLQMKMISDDCTTEISCGLINPFCI